MISFVGKLVETKSFVCFQSLTDRLLRMKGWDSDLEEEGGEEGGEETSNGTAGKGEENGRGDDSQGHLQKVQKLIYAAKVNNNA